MSGAAHTPGTALPWEIYRSGATQEIAGPAPGIESVDGVSIVVHGDVDGADFLGVRGDGDAAAAMQNAAYIVHACNTLPALQAHADAMAEALRRIEQRTRALPDDTAADNKRDKFHAHSIAQSALAAYQATKP